DSASMPTAPVPANRSRTRAPATAGPMTSKRVTRTRSAVGRVWSPRGARSRRPRSCPPMTRMRWLPDRCQIEALTPASDERLAEQPVLREPEPSVARHQLTRILPRLLEKSRVGEEAGGAELRQSRLACPEELARAADLEVYLGEPESIHRGYHRLQPLLPFVRHGAAREQDAIRFVG